MTRATSKTKDLGAAVRRRRREAGLTQERLAALAGVGTRFVSELERGKPTVQLGKTLDVLESLGLELRVDAR